MSKNEIELSNPIHNNNGSMSIRITETSRSLLSTQSDPYQFTISNLLVNLKNDYNDIYNNFLIFLIIKPEINLKDNNNNTYIKYYIQMLFYYYTRICVIIMLILNVYFITMETLLIFSNSGCGGKRIGSIRWRLILAELSTLPIFLRTISKYCNPY